jgi:DNA invertase Pin-like site-specific DNA recombinase
MTDSEAISSVAILPLDEAWAVSPTVNVVLYGRVSSYNPAQRKSLADQIAFGQRHINALLEPATLKAICAGVEPGRISAKRPKLILAFEQAAKHQALIVARDVSRLIRAESYDRKTNRDVSPTPEEMGQLLELATEYSVIVATIEDPTLTESQRHSQATKAGGKAGRPSTIDYYEAMRILETFECGESYTDIAARLGISRSKIQRLLDQKVPADLIPSAEGMRWKEFDFPSRAYRLAYKLRQFRDSEGGTPVSKR